MLHKTRGIVFRFTKYGEASIIVTIFTELFGLQAYIVNGVRNKSTKSKIALYQPLTLLDLVVYHRENANLNRIKEIRCLHPFQSLSIDIKKSAIAMFVNEVINKTVKEESHAKEIFEFLLESMITLDAMIERYENFHLSFLLKLSRYLGFGAHNSEEVLGGIVASPKIDDIIRGFIESPYEDFISITNDERKTALELLLKFYAAHIDGLGEIRSVQVLREIMR